MVVGFGDVDVPGGFVRDVCSGLVGVFGLLFMVVGFVDVIDVRGGFVRDVRSGLVGDVRDVSSGLVGDVCSGFAFVGFDVWGCLVDHV
jgi:hypothetical protein